MSDLAESYTENLHDHFKILYANWPPGKPVSLGDYGTLEDDIFVSKGNIKRRFGIEFTETSDDTKDDYDYKSADSTTINFFAKGDILPNGSTNAKASVEISFSSEDAIFFNAADCIHKSIQDIDLVEDAIWKLLDQEKWDEDYVIVTTVLEAKASTIIASSGDKSSIKLEASADAVQSIKLSDASIGLNIKSESNIGLKIITKEGMTPLIALAGFQPKWKIGPIKIGRKFRSIQRLDAGEIHQVENGESKRDRFVFMQR